MIITYAGLQSVTLTRVEPQGQGVKDFSLVTKNVYTVQKTRAVHLRVISVQNCDLIGNLVAPYVKNCYNEWQSYTIQI